MNESPRLLKTWQENQEMQSCDEKMNTEQIEKSFTSLQKKLKIIIIIHIQQKTYLLANTKI